MASRQCSVQGPQIQSSVRFPISSLDNFSNLEANLSSQDNYNILVSQLALIRGTDHADAARKMLASLMTVQFGCELNWRGVGLKKGIEGSNFDKSIFDALKKSFPDIPDIQKRAIKAIQRWLQNCTRRQLYYIEINDEMDLNEKSDV